MSEVIAVWDDFSGGHWGNLGPVKAEKNQFGGYGIVDSSGYISMPNEPVDLTFSTAARGQVFGMFNAWGSDGRVYYIGALGNGSGTSTVTSMVYRFAPTPGTAQTITTVTTITFMPTKPPDFALVADELYMTLYSNRTYRIAITGNTTTALTGTYGNAPAGRAIALYGERLVVGGVKDARFGNVANRIVFSGDDTNNNPTDRTAWETLNYFDVGPPDAVITGLYATRDYLVVVMEDQTIWTVTGVLGSSAIARRMNGYAKGSGAVEQFRPNHGSVDPSQTKVWLYDHATKGFGRFNGASYMLVPNFGYPSRNRTQTTNAYGDVISYGRPGDVAVFGVNIGAQSGVAANTSTNPAVVLYRNGVAGMASPSVNFGFSETDGYPAFSPSRIVGNDRGELIVCTERGTGIDIGANGGNPWPTFAYWNANAPDWDAIVNSDTDVPYVATGTAGGTVMLPYKEVKTNAEWEIDGVLVDFIPYPYAVTTSGMDLSTPTTTQVSLSLAGIRSPGSGRGNFVTSTVTFSTTVTYGSTYGAWPNIRTEWFPCRTNAALAVSPSVSLTAAKLVRVRLVGQQKPGRTV